MTRDAKAGFRFTIHYDSLFLVHDNDENRPLATAFCFIKPDWVVTARHAVVEMDIPRQSLALQSRRHGLLRASVLFLHPTHDLAVLRIEESSPCDVPLFPSHEAYTGTSGLVGCGWAPSWSDREGYDNTLVAHRIDGYEREVRRRDSGDESLILFDAPWMEGGYSGGPIFGEGGGVVAVLIQLVRSADGMTRGRATNIVHLLRFLSFPC